MKNAIRFTALFLSCLFYLGCSEEEKLVLPDQVMRSPKMISSRAPDATMLAQIGFDDSEPNARIAQVYNEAEAVVAVYESVPEVEFVFIPYENAEFKVGIFPFYKGEYIPFQADLEKVGDDDIKITTKGSVATYIREGNVMKGVDFVMQANVMTADEIKEMRTERRTDSGVDSMIGYYLQCMEDMAKQAAWYCGGCATGQLFFALGCSYFSPCAWGSNVTCIGLAIADNARNR